MKELYLVSNEVFFEPLADGTWLVYLPLAQVIFKANLALVEVLQGLIRGESIRSNEIGDSTLAELIAAGILVSEAEQVNQPLRQEFQWPRSAITLFLTSDCNLRCIYCYANGGTSPRYMKPEIARAAIDYVTTELPENNTLELHFHGGGEPFLAFDLMRECVEYAREQCRNRHLNLKLSVGTNGVISDEKIRYAVENNFTITISCDGMPAIQNMQRPTKEGKGSSQNVERTICRLVNLAAHFIVRTTVTQISVHLLPSIVEYFHNIGVSQVAVEPVFACGRCLETCTPSLDPIEFARSYLSALHVAQELGINLSYSGARFDRLVEHFCGASRGNFCVTDEGYISACYEVTDATDPAADLFFYGKYDTEQHRLKIWNDKLPKFCPK